MKGKCFKLCLVSVDTVVVKVDTKYGVSSVLSESPLEDETVSLVLTPAQLLPDPVQSSAKRRRKRSVAATERYNKLGGKIPDTCKYCE